MTKPRRHDAAVPLMEQNMIEDTETNPAADTETVTEGAEVAEPEVESDELEPEAEEGQPEEEYEDFEYEGKKARIPKWLKPLTMMQADYTRKTQETAETRKQAEARMAAAEQREKQVMEDLKEHAALHALEQSILQYEQYNWRDLIQQNPQQAQILQLELDQMRSAYARLANGLQEKHSQRQFEAERARANRIKERDAALAKEISGFSPALMSKIQDYAISDGYTPEEAQSIWDARYVKTLNKARLWDEYQARVKANAAKQKQQQEPAPAPTPVVSARKPSNTNRLRDDLSVDEWRRRREAQLRARGG